MDNELTETIDDERGARLVRYVAGRCSAAEAEEMRVWIAAAPGRADVVASLRRTWELAERPRGAGRMASSGAWDVDAAWSELCRRYEARRAARHAVPIRSGRAAVRKRRTVPAWAMRAAAAVVLLAGGAATAVMLSGPGADAPEAVAMREYATDRGQRAELRLPDGTRVVLSVASRVRVPEDYGRRARDVYLEGEALFEVRHDERRPFRVHAAGVVAEDLGTVFGVRSYGAGEPSTVVVAEGRVEVKRASPAAGAEEAYRLDPGQLARVGGDGSVRIERGVDVAPHLAFAEGRLVFRDTPLGAAAAQLGRWYGLEVRLADTTLAALPLTASFQDEPASQALELISLSLGLRRTREGDVVTFHR